MTRDPDYGPVLAVGLGGRAVETLSLAAVSLAPLGEGEALQLVAEAPGLEADARLRARRWRRRSSRSAASQSTIRRSLRSTSTP